MIAENQLHFTIKSNEHSISYSSIAIAILSILYIIGIVGIALPIHPDFVLLSPVNLMVSLLVMLVFHPKWGRGSILFLVLCYLVGQTAEIIGVQTGLLFGEYYYGPVLGPKWAETPFMIGVNWVILVYASGVLSNLWLKGKSWFSKASFGALLMVVLDFFIEPVAMDIDLWQWPGLSAAPLQNYLAWFGIAFINHTLFQYFLKDVKNKVALALLILQFLFFILLNIL